MGVNRNSSLAAREEVFFATATLASGLQAKNHQFRQRDLRFFLELFSNWLEVLPDASPLTAQNTQISRYLDGRAREGILRRSVKRGTPWYFLTPVGLVELVQRVVSGPYLQQKEQFFFAYYFIKSYRPKLTAFVKERGSRFPYAQRIRLESLWDEKKMVIGQIEQTRQAMRQLDQRMEEAKATDRYVRDGIRKNKSDQAILKGLSREFPYALSSQKSLTELISALPKEARAWELREGYRKRVEDMHVPFRHYLAHYQRALQQLPH